MNTSKIIEIIMYCLPALITGAIAYYFFKTHVDNEENRRRFYLLKNTQKAVLPLKLQAYERMTIFLERMNPVKLALRISPIDKDTNLYANMLIQTIENEFEHNLAQQIYISPEAWQIINKSKLAIVGNIRVLSTKAQSADELRNLLLTSLSSESDAPTNLAILFIKNEVSQIIG